MTNRRISNMSHVQFRCYTITTANVDVPPLKT